MGQRNEARGMAPRVHQDAKLPLAKRESESCMRYEDRHQYHIRLPANTDWQRMLWNIRKAGVEPKTSRIPSQLLRKISLGYIKEPPARFAAALINLHKRIVEDGQRKGLGSGSWL